MNDIAFHGLKECEQCRRLVVPDGMIALIAVLLGFFRPEAKLASLAAGTPIPELVDPRMC